MLRTRRLAILQFFLWVAVYTVAELAVSSLFGAGRVQNAWRVPVCLLPMVPAVLSVFPLMQAYRNQDELQRRIQAEGILFSFVLTAIVTFSYGFLERYADFPTVSMFFVWPVLALFMTVGQVLAAARYR